MVKLNFASTSFDLNNAPIVESVQYALSLLATNLNGNSNESNTIDFEKSSDRKYENLGMTMYTVCARLTYCRGKHLDQLYDS